MSNRPWSKKEFKLLRESGGWDSDACETPQWLFEKLNEHFNFFWDACCSIDNCRIGEPLYQHWVWTSPQSWNYLPLDMLTEYNQMCDRVTQHNLNPSEPSRVDNPGNVIFMNPPYSRPLPFIIKAWQDAKHFKVVALLRDDPTTDWYNWIVENHKDTHFINIHQRNSETIVNAVERLLKCTNEKPCNSVGVIHLRRRIRFEYQGRALPFSSNFPHCLMILDRRCYDRPEN